MRKVAVITALLTAALTVATCAGSFKNAPVASAGASASRNGGADAGACATCLLSCGSKGCDEAVKITARLDHTCARRASGQVICWGWNKYGQLGDGTYPYRVTPTNISPL